MTQNRNKIATSFRLSPEAMGMLDRLKERTGLSQAGILELAIRRMAEAEGVRGTPKPSDLLSDKPSEA